MRGCLPSLWILFSVIPFHSLSPEPRAVAIHIHQSPPEALFTAICLLSPSFLFAPQ